MRRVEECRARVSEADLPPGADQAPDSTGLADDLVRAWNAPGVATRTRQEILRTLIADIIADVDDSNREVVLTIHWKSGQHSVLRVRKHRVNSIRRNSGESCFSVGRERWAMADNKEAAKCLEVTSHVIRRLIVDRILPPEQVVPGAPQIEACHLQNQEVIKAIRNRNGPWHRNSKNKYQCLQTLEEAGYNEATLATDFIERSMMLGSISIVPSSREAFRPVRWASVYLMALERVDYVAMSSFRSCAS